MINRRTIGGQRRKIVKAFAGRELVNNAESVQDLKQALNHMLDKINALQHQITEQEDNLVRYMHPDKYEEWLKDRYYQIYGKQLNFDDLKTFTEKMQWIKLYGSDEQQTRLADKLLAKEYIEGQIGKKYVVPLLGVYDKFDEIDFDTLPKSFVIKVNNGSSTNIIVKNKNELDVKAAKDSVNKWMRRSLFTYGLEMHYKHIKPKIIIEKYLEFSQGIEDYKFYCFGGKAEYLLVIADRYTNEKMAFYDMKFRKQDFSILDGMEDIDVEKPEKFDEMLKLTNKLAKALGYPFLRVDWYIDKKGNLYFGEFTFNPGGGWYFFKPEKYDRIWGDKITLPQTRNRVP